MTRYLLSTFLLASLYSRAGLAAATPDAPTANPTPASSPSAAPAEVPDAPPADTTPANTVSPSATGEVGAVAPAAPAAATAPAIAGVGSDSFSEAPSDKFAASSSEPDESAPTHSLDVYGFADFTYQRLLVPSSNLWARTYTGNRSFSVGNFNVFLDETLGSSWRALAEVRFLYLPNGDTEYNPGAGKTLRADTTVLDYTGFEEPIQWGGIHIERVYLEHKFGKLLNVMVGQFLTPYGIWNVDHASPTIIGIKKPFIIATNFFPQQQMGLQAYGSLYLDPVELGYNLTVSNGRAPVQYLDYNDDKAFGGRLYAKTEALGTLTVGTSFYRGNYYDRDAQYARAFANNVPVLTENFTTTSKYQELSLGADLKWEYSQVLVQGEIAMNEAHFAPNGQPRALAVGTTQGFVADYRRWGLYGLAGYNFRALEVMPYVLVQHFSSPDDPYIPPGTTGYQFGLNYRPMQAVTLKVEYQTWSFGGPGAAGTGVFPFRLLASQVAWAF